MQSAFAIVRGTRDPTEHQRQPASAVGEATIELTSATDTYTVTTASTPSGEVGLFEIRNVEPGTYTLSAARKGTRPTSVIVTVTAGQVLDVDPVLIPPATLSGTVTNLASNSPAGGITVTLYVASEYPTTIYQQTTTDADGRYAFADLDAPQAYVVEISTPTTGALASKTLAAQRQRGRASPTCRSAVDRRRAGSLVTAARQVDLTAAAAPADDGGIRISMDRQVPVGAGQTVDIPVLIVHDGPAPTSVTLSVLGLDPRWIPPPVTVDAVAAGETVELVLRIPVERGALAARYPFVVAAQTEGDRRRPAAHRGGGVGPGGRRAGTAGWSVRPQQPVAVFRRRFEVTVTNPGHEPRTVSLLAQTAAGAGIFLDKSQVDVPAGRTARVGGRLSVRRPRHVRLREHLPVQRHRTRHRGVADRRGGVPVPAADPRLVVRTDRGRHRAGAVGHRSD